MREKKNEIGMVPDLPNDRDTERAVLATMMRYSDQMARYSNELGEDLFFHKLEAAMYRTVAGVIAAGQVPNVNALFDWANSHDTGYDLQRNDFAEVIAQPSPSTFRQDVMRLQTMARRRKAWEALQVAARNVLDPFSDVDAALNDAVEELTGTQTANKEGIASMKDSLGELRNVVMNNAQNKRTAMPTGFSLLDDKYLLRPGTLTVLAAFTSVGKTAFALNIAKRVAQENYPVAYYSLEMGKAELAARLIAEDMEVPASDILNQNLGQTLMDAFEKAVEQNELLPIYIDERSTISFDNTIRSIRTLATTNGVRLVVIDYLQIYTQSIDNVEASLAAMARQAKNIAMETKTAVILLSQLNRSDDQPSIKMLRGSGQIEESADNIVLIDRPAAYPDYDKRLNWNYVKVKKEKGKTVIEKSEDDTVVGGNFDKKTRREMGTAACLILCKGRGVGTGIELVNFNGEMMRFVSSAKTEQQKTEEQEEAERQAYENALPF